MSGATEAILLGFSSGPACLAACGPVLLPWMASERRSTGGNVALVGAFLSGRLTGYLAFAAALWAAGTTLPANPNLRGTLFGIAYTGMAALLMVYAVGAARPRSCSGQCPSSRAALLQLRFRSFAPYVLGLLTGLNLCPPFLAASVRAIESVNIIATLTFFTLFFAGTAVWTLPAIAGGWLARFEAAAFVARLTMILMALYYGYLGLLTLVARLYHG